MTLLNDTASINIIVLNKGKSDVFIFLINYLGYGGSTGCPTQAGLFCDAGAIFVHFSPAHKNVAVMGRSLGSGLAMHLAAT